MKYFKNVLFYTRLPKTGSMTFRALLSHLAKKRGFNDVALSIDKPFELIMNTKEERVGQSFEEGATLISGEH